MNNNDWIPVSERLPDLHESIFAKFKGTEKWEERMFEKTSDIVLCTLRANNGMVNIVTTGRLNDEKWELDGYNRFDCFEVTAWMPFPKPYLKE